MGDFGPTDPLGYSPQMKLPGAAINDDMVMMMSNRVANFREIPKILAITYNLRSNSLIFLGIIFILNMMHKTKAERCGELFVENMLILPASLCNAGLGNS